MRVTTAIAPVFSSIIPLSVLLVSGAAAPPRSTEAVSSAALAARLQALSTAAPSGRLAGTDGERRIALAMAEAFRQLGLQPPAAHAGATGDLAPERFLQPVPIALTEFHAPPRLRIHAGGVHVLAPGTEFAPVRDSPAGTIDAPLAFVGFGIRDARQGHNDYKNFDATGAAVVFMDGRPAVLERDYRLADKVQAARRAGAVAYLIVAEPEARFAELAPDDALPGVVLAPAAAARLLAPVGLDLVAARAAMAHDSRPRPLRLDARAELVIDSRRSAATAYNVIGVRPGAAADAPAVIIAAHHDDFGTDPGRAMLNRPLAAATLLEAVRALAGRTPQPHTLVAVSLTGTMRAGAGVRRFLATPVVPLERVRMVVMFDAVAGPAPVIAAHALPAAAAGVLARIAPPAAVAAPVPLGFGSFARTGLPGVYLAAAPDVTGGWLEPLAENARAGIAIVTAAGND